MFLKSLFQGKPLRVFEEKVLEVNALESEISALSAEKLKEESVSLQEQVAKGETLDALLPRAFALVREAAKRTLNQRPFDVQLIGGMALHRGSIAEMGTGEGKTLAAVAPVYLNALTKKGVHVVTVNDYLARRDAVWMGQIYRALGLSVACLGSQSEAYLYDPDFVAEADPEQGPPLLDKERDTTGSFLIQKEYLRPISRREAYLADITYGTNHEFGFDFLRDNLTYSITAQVQRDRYFAVIDEVDSILIDEARTPLIISAPDVQSSDFYKVFAKISEKLEKATDYEVDEKARTVLINDSGIEKVEHMLGVKNFYAPEHIRLVHYLEESLKAKELFKKDKEYVSRNGEIIIVDEFTGRMLAGRRYSGGLHQAIEAKEGVLVKEESRTYAKISIQNYFRLYEKIAGMTGTAQTSAEEFHKVYGLEVVSIPANRPVVRTDHSDKIYKNADAKWDAIVKDIKERREKGQPVLVGTTSIQKNELLSSLLAQAGIPHEVLNAKKHEEEGRVIAQAGKRAAVTIATNMAGRGVDIILGGNPPEQKEAHEVRNVGGLHVIATDRHEARRIDNQLRGRSGRQGDPGSTQFFLSLEDDLLRIFGGERLQSFMNRLDVPDDMPIDAPIISKLVAQAQSKVEGFNFDIRKHLLDYDDVLNRQRTAFYKRRQEVLGGISHETLANIILDAAKRALDAITASHAQHEHEGHEHNHEEELKGIFEETGIATKESPFPEGGDEGKIEGLLAKRSMEVAFNPDTHGRLLSILDMLWMNHLEDLEELQESVRLRAYSQKDPLVEYREESRRLFDMFWDHFGEWVFSNMFKMANSKSQGAVQTINLGTQATGLKDIGRNDLCPCGSGKKYKKCGLINSEEHQKLTRK